MEETSKSAGEERSANLLQRLAPILAVVGLCWLMFVINNLLWHGRLSDHGIIPRHLGSLPAIVWAPFLHTSFGHLAANTIPLLVLGGILCMRSRGEFVTVTILGILFGGALTWLVARGASHVGASGLVFCFFGYLGSLAYFRRTIGTLLVSLACVLFYGGMLRGIVPTSTPISWEGHLAGFLVGIAMAWAASRFDKTPVAAATPEAATAVSPNRADLL
jgi:membrane associated rhomboid family serine protease